MTRGELIAVLRARGTAALPHHVQEAVASFRLSPPAGKDGSGRRVYTAAHADQIERHLTRGTKWRMRLPGFRDVEAGEDEGEGEPS